MEPDVNIPTLVKLEFTTFDAKVVPVKIPALGLIQVKVPLPVVLNTCPLEP